MHQRRQQPSGCACFGFQHGLEAEGGEGLGRFGADGCNSQVWELSKASAIRLPMACVIERLQHGPLFELLRQISFSSCVLRVSCCARHSLGG